MDGYSRHRYIGLGSFFIMFMFVWPILTLDHTVCSLLGQLRGIRLGDGDGLIWYSLLLVTPSHRFWWAFLPCPRVILTVSLNDDKFILEITLLVATSACTLPSIQIIFRNALSYNIYQKNMTNSSKLSIFSRCFIYYGFSNVIQINTNYPMKQN